MLLGSEPTLCGPSCRVVPATGAETTQQAASPQPAGRGEQGHLSPQSTSGDSDDADEAQPKRWDQRDPHGQSHHGSSEPQTHCPSYAIPKCRVLRCKQAELHTEVNSSKLTPQQTLQESAQMDLTTQEPQSQGCGVGVGGVRLPPQLPSLPTWVPHPPSE